MEAGRLRIITTVAVVIAIISLAFAFVRGARKPLATLSGADILEALLLPGDPIWNSPGVPGVDHNETVTRISMGLLSDTEQGWRLRWKKFQAQSMRQVGKHDEKGPQYFQNNWEPSIACEYEERLGNIGDGGKWLCNPTLIARPALVYSLGSNGDFSFETAIHDHFQGQVEIHTFDPAPSFEGTPKFVKYHSWAMGAADEGNTKTLPTIVETLGHRQRQIDVFKIDIEGTECNSLTPLLNSDLWPDIRQVQIEVHLAEGYHCSSETIHNLFKAFSRRGLQIFHKEANLLFGGQAAEFSLVKVAWPPFLRKYRTRSKTDPISKGE